MYTFIFPVLHDCMKAARQKRDIISKIPLIDAAACLCIHYMAMSSSLRHDGRRDYNKEDPLWCSAGLVGFVSEPVDEDIRQDTC